jgi:hypothetical protein
MVNRSRREGARVVFGADHFPAFSALYEQAMARLNATETLRFGAEYFERLRALPFAELAVLTDSSGLTAGGIFLWGPRFGHYHLAARRPDAPNWAANAILHAALERAAELGLEGLHLGGGTTRADDDPLLRFKASLGGERKQFSVARLIIDPARFGQLTADWTQKTGRAPEWLLGYRQPIR